MTREGTRRRQAPLTEAQLLRGYGVPVDVANEATYPQALPAPGWRMSRRRCACGERTTELRVSERDSDRLELHCLACGRRWTRLRTRKPWQPRP